MTIAMEERNCPVAADADELNSCYELYFWHWRSRTSSIIFKNRNNIVSGKQTDDYIHEANCCDRPVDVI